MSENKLEQDSPTGESQQPAKPLAGFVDETLGKLRGATTATLSSSAPGAPPLAAALPIQLPVQPVQWTERRLLPAMAIKPSAAARRGLNSGAQRLFHEWSTPGAVDRAVRVATRGRQLSQPEVAWIRDRLEGIDEMIADREAACGVGHLCPIDNDTSVLAGVIVGGSSGNVEAIHLDCSSDPLYRTWTDIDEKLARDAAFQLLKEGDHPWRHWRGVRLTVIHALSGEATTLPLDEHLRWEGPGVRRLLAGMDFDPSEWFDEEHECVICAIPNEDGDE